MPTNLTETSTFDNPITVPADGDPRNAASVDGAFQALADRTRWLLNNHPIGALVGNGLLWAPGDGTVHAGPVSALLGDGTRVAKATATNLTLGVLPNNTWVCVFVYNSGSGAAPVLAFEVNITLGPDPTGIWKSDGMGGADTTRRFLASFRTDGGGAPLPFRTERGRCRYRPSGVALGLLGLAVLSAGGGTSGTQDVTSRVPPHARRALFYSIVVGSMNPGTIKPSGDTGTAWNLANETRAESEVAGSPLAVDYTAGASSALTLYVLGYDE